MMMNYDLGIIGNCRSGALINSKGEIVWSCLPDFDSNAVFCSLLDEKKGGFFGLESSSKMQTQQHYLEGTNILRTHFVGADTEFEIIDFMPRYHTQADGAYSPPDMIRLVRPIKGNPKVKINYKPTLEFAKGKTTTVVKTEYIKSFTEEDNYESVFLYTNADKEKVVNGEEFDLCSNLFFLVSYNEKLLEQSYKRSNLKFERTKVYWMNWSEKTCVLPKYNEYIQRSALVLKLLSYDKTGAVIAALTTSLPETIGEERNWDYRFCWIRDASMTVRVLTRLNHEDEAKRYLNYILSIIPHKHDRLQIMYGIRGEKKLTEKILDWLDGYMDSKPVRTGNAAYFQKQNDIYGVLMDIVYQYFKIYQTTLDSSEEFWTITRGIVKRVEIQWQDEDKGIWEIRKGFQHFTFSKVLCWVAIDRAVKVAEILGKQQYIEMWSVLRDEIADEIKEKAWNEKIGAYTQYYGAEYLDAAVLQMEPYGFIDAKDPRFVATVEKIYESLMVDGLMFRYKVEDDFGTPSSSFTICSFWMISCLYKIGQKEKAEKLFQRILQYTNHLDLLSEDIDFKTKRLLGNFPQGYSHLALIETAILLTGEEIN